MTLYTLASIILETVKMPPMTAHTWTMKCRISSFVYQYVTVVGAKSYLVYMYSLPQLHTGIIVSPHLIMIGSILKDIILLFIE